MFDETNQLNQEQDGVVLDETDVDESVEIEDDVESGQESDGSESDGSSDGSDSDGGSGGSGSGDETVGTGDDIDDGAILDLAAPVEADDVVEDTASADANEAEPEPVRPAVPAKRMSLKEKLAARRLAEQGGDDTDQEGKWYVLHTYSGYENKVKKTIETLVESLDLGDRVYEVIVPTQEEIEIKNGQRQTVLKKVFPGYVLVRMELDD